MEIWRGLIRQAWLLGLLNREMKREIGAWMVNGVIYNVYNITSKGFTFLSDPRETLLPAVDHESQKISEEKEDDSSVKTVTRYTTVFALNSLQPIPIVFWVVAHGSLNISCDFGLHGCLPGSGRLSGNLWYAMNK